MWKGRTSLTTSQKVDRREMTLALIIPISWSELTQILTKFKFQVSFKFMVSLKWSCSAISKKVNNFLVAQTVLKLWRVEFWTGQNYRSALENSDRSELTNADWQIHNFGTVRAILKLFTILES